MTYFLTGQPEVQITTPDIKPPTWFEGLGASISMAMRDSNANFRRERDVLAERGAMAREAAPRLGQDAARAMLEEFNTRATDLGLRERVVDIGDDPVAALEAMGPNGSKKVLEMAREAAAKDPAKWAGIDLSDEALEARVTERRVAEDEDEAQIIAAMPGGSGAAQLIGGMIGATADVRNLPFLFAGGGSGSILKVMGREALLNTTAEAVTLRSRFDVAEELGKPDPNVTETLLMAAGAGAVLGGAVEGLARGLHYFRGRSEIRTALPGLSKQDSDLVITAVEDALVKGSDPVEAMTRAMRETAPPPVTRAPLILDESMAVTPEPTALAPDPITTAPLEPVPSVAVYGDDARNDISLTLREIFDDALAEKERGNVAGVAVTSMDFEFVDAGAKAFLNGESQAPKAKTREGQILSDFGFNKAKQQVEVLGYKPVETSPQNTTDQIVATAKRGIAKAEKPKKEVLGWLKRQGVDPDGWLGTELKSRGLSNKTNRGLFRKGGLREIDNIVADELDQAIPGVSWRAGRDDTGTYLDRDGLLRLLDEEIGPKTRARKYDPRRAYADPDTEDRGWMVNDLEARKFAEPERWQEVLAQDFDAYLASTGRTLLPREREEIIGILSTRGGDAEDLVYSAMSREIDEAEMALLSGTRGEGDGRSDVPWGDEAGVGQVPDRPSGSPAGQSQTPARNAPESGTGGIQPQVERSAAGDQYVAPGIAATTERQRLEARQNARLQGGNRAADEGLFDVAARGQMDMFSDPASKEARVVQDAIVADFQDQIAKGEDVTVDLGDGKGPRTMSAIIKDLEADEAFVARLDLCGMMGGPTE